MSSTAVPVTQVTPAAPAAPAPASEPDSESAAREGSASRAKPVRASMTERCRIREATPADREAIYQLRHDVYAAELHQHQENEQRRLVDALDDRNLYILAEDSRGLLAHVSVTPPGGKYSLEKYLDPSQIPFALDEGTFEVRLLTVAERYRGHTLPHILVYAVFRTMIERGGTRLMALGRKEALSFYERIGMHRMGRTVQSGAVSYELISAPADELMARWNGDNRFVQSLGQQYEWAMSMPFIAEKDRRRSA